VGTVLGAPDEVSVRFALNRSGLTPTRKCVTCSTMTRIGIRELRQRASDYLRRVEAGETIEVTDRGRPIALLTPIPKTPPMERLRASGDIQRAAAAWDDIPAPLPLEDGEEAPSVILERLRSDER
jgi:prevent-host-death family protein